MKDQKLPKGQLGLPDCKKNKMAVSSQLKEAEQYALLVAIANEDLSFREAVTKAKQLRKEAKVVAYYSNRMTTNTVTFTR